MEWIRIDKQNYVLPFGAIAGGYTTQGEITFVARCSNGSAAGAYIPSKRAISVADRGEKFRDTCDVLVCWDPEIFFWTDAEKGEVPDLAVATRTGRPVYVARTRPNTSLTGLKELSMQQKKIKIDKDFKGPMLGKLLHSESMYIAYGGSEYIVNQYQVLCAYVPPPVKYSMQSPHSWVPASNGHVPKNGFIGGRTENDEPTFVARLLTSPEEHDVYEAGYVLPSEKLCYLPNIHGYTSDSYEVLVTSNPENFTWSPEVDESRIVRLNIGKPPIFYIGRTKAGCPGLKQRADWDNDVEFGVSDSGKEIIRLVGSIRYFSFEPPELYVIHNDELFIFKEFETLVVSKVMNSLQELCRYVVLQWTSGIPVRINRLPLPKHLKDYCQLRAEEKVREYWGPINWEVIDWDYYESD